MAFKRRAAYSLAAGATVTTVAMPTDGAPVYSGLRNLEVVQGYNQILKLDSDGFNDIKLKNYVFAGGNYQGAFLSFAPGIFLGFFGGPDNLGYANALTPGTLIDHGTDSLTGVSMAYGTAGPNTQFNDANSAYLGFGFPISGDNSDLNHFAWMRVTIDNALGSFIINDWAFELQPGVGIKAGDKGVHGDYNHDGIVNAADYTIWRDTFGAGTPAGADADGNANGVIDSGDFTEWKNAFNNTMGAGNGGLAGAPAPEPGTLGLLAAGSAGVVLLRRLRRGRS